MSELQRKTETIMRRIAKRFQAGKFSRTLKRESDAEVREALARHGWTVAESAS